MSAPVSDQTRRVGVWVRILVVMVLAPISVVVVPILALAALARYLVTRKTSTQPIPPRREDDVEAIAIRAVLGRPKTTLH